MLIVSFATPHMSKKIETFLSISWRMLQGGKRKQINSRRGEPQLSKFPFSDNDFPFTKRNFLFTENYFSIKKLFFREAGLPRKQIREQTEMTSCGLMRSQKHRPHASFPITFSIAISAQTQRNLKTRNDTKLNSKFHIRICSNENTQKLPGERWRDWGAVIKKLF